MRNDGFVEKYSALGDRLRRWLSGTDAWPELDEAVEREAVENIFFTPYMQRRALEAVADGFLTKNVLEAWLERYADDFHVSEKVCGVVAAGNIPAVAFHDILSVLAAGWRPLVKLSSKDRYLLPVLFGDADFSLSTDGWKVDALLTMGGDRAAEHFSSEFRGIPSVIRRGRFSAAVITGNEGPEELDALAEDMLLYYGLGCRSVTCLLVPEGYCFDMLGEAAAKFAGMHLGRIIYDNYRKNKAVLTMEGESFLDMSPLLFRNMRAGGIPIDKCTPYGRSLQVGEVWYAEYASVNETDMFINGNIERIQKIIRNFGSAQRPAVDDFPDGVDTVRLLLDLK